MALSALQLDQLAGLLAGHSKLFTANNPGQNEFANYLLQSAQAGQMGELQKEQEKKAKKAQKGAFGGKVGALLGTAAGLAIPIPGVNVAVAGALGGGLGGLAGQLVTGGSPNLGSFALDAAQGGLSGYQYGKAGELQQVSDTAAVQPDVPASPTPAQKIESGIANALPDANVLSGAFDVGVQPGTGPIRNTSSAYGVTPGTGPLLQPGTAGVAAAAPQAGFPSRFGSALAHIAAMQTPKRSRMYDMLYRYNTGY